MSDSAQVEQRPSEGDNVKKNPNALVYRIDHDPPWPLSFLLGFQVCI